MRKELAIFQRETFLYLSGKHLYMTDDSFFLFIRLFSYLFIVTNVGLNLMSKICKINLSLHHNDKWMHIDLIKFLSLGMHLLSDQFVCMYKFDKYMVNSS